MMDKKHKFGFIVLSPEHNIGLLQSTMMSINREYRKADVSCVVGDTAKKKDIENMSKFCQVFKGGDTITSLINMGLENGWPEWNIIVFAGTQIKRVLTKKIFLFATNEKDVLFPIIIDYNRRGYPTHIYKDFPEATLNGMTMHKRTFDNVGKFSENPIKVSKQFWGLDAIDYGCQFKAVLGAKVI